MNIKVLVVLLFVVAALPFLVLSIVSEIRKQHFMAVLGVLLAVVGLDQFIAGRLVLKWLSTLDHFMVFISALLLAILAWLIRTTMASRRKRRNLRWTRRPGQSEFAWACVRHLMRNGWRDRGHLDVVGAHGFWTSRGNEAITFFFCVNDVPINAIRGGMKTDRRAAFPEVKVVTWDSRPDSLSNALHEMKWNTIEVSAFKKGTSGDVTGLDSTSQAVIARE